MTHQLKVPNQKPDEKVLIALKPHWIHVLKVIIMLIGLYLVPVVLFVVMNQVIGGIMENPPAYVLIVLMLALYFLAANLISFNAFLDRELDIWIVTNYRIVATEQKGLFNRTFAEHLIEKVQDVSATRKGMMQTILNFGDVSIQTASENERFVFNDVKKPEEVAKIINRLLSEKIQSEAKQANKHEI